MTHLTPAEFVDSVDGTLASARAAHLERCDACRAQVGVLRDAMHGAQVESPEPSPLFWDHFPQRVQGAIHAAPEPAPVWRRPLVALGVTVAAVLVSVVALRAPQPLTIHPARVSALPDRVDVTVSGRAEQTDAAWEVLTAAAADLQIDEAHAAGLGVPIAALDKAVLDLTPAEREELGRLLQAELKRSGA